MFQLFAKRKAAKALQERVEVRKARRAVIAYNLSNTPDNWPVQRQRGIL